MAPLGQPIPSIPAAHVVIEGPLVLFLETRILVVVSLSEMDSLGRTRRGRIATGAKIGLQELRMKQ